MNAKPFEVAHEKLDEVLRELGVTSPSIATAINGTFVARSQRNAVVLKEGDRLEVLSPMQGG
ncbi:sulfur carrier protein ThiS [uncultured Roseovarius sp.]|uniref:sulfur carrier protein ThiS n=1 Tax=uncultured Roseovarius sp. TaxID=293344 RepID=UPI00345BE0BC